MTVENGVRYPHLKDELGMVFEVGRIGPPPERHPA